MVAFQKTVKICIFVHQKNPDFSHLAVSSEQPEGGSDDWYEIKSRKNEKEKGTINIVVKFHVDVEHDADFKVQTHIKLLSRFPLLLLKKSYFSSLNILKESFI